MQRITPFPLQRKLRMRIRAAKRNKPGFPSDRNSGVNKSTNALFSINTPTTDNWIGRAVKGSNGMNCNVIVNYDNCRAEIYINTGDRDKNKRIFDYLFKNKDAIELQFGEQLTWQRLDNKITSRIRIDRDWSYTDVDQRQQVIEFLTSSANKLMKIFTPYSIKYNKK